MNYFFVSLPGLNDAQSICAPARDLSMNFIGFGLQIRYIMKVDMQVFNN